MFLARLTAHEHATYTMADWIQTSILDPHRREVLSRAASVTDQSNLDIENVSDADRTKLARVAERCEGLKGRASARQTQALLGELLGELPGIQSEWGRTVVEDQIRTLADAERRLQEYDNQARPRSLWAVWCLLLWLTVVGVWGPLSVLPGIPGSWSRTLMLYGFLIGVVGFEAFLCLELFRMWWRRRSFVWRWSP